MRATLQTGFLRLLLSTVLLIFCTSSSAQIDSSLLAAIKSCDFQSVQEKLRTVNALNHQDVNGANALMWAAYYCDLPMFQYLEKQGAKPPALGVIFINNEGEYFSSLQSLAASQGKLTLLKYLSDSLKLSLPDIEKQYNSRSWRKQGQSLLSFAAENGHLEVVKYLLQKGVDADMVDVDSTSTPLIKAAESQHWNVVHLLMQTNSNKQRYGEKAKRLMSAETKLQQALTTKMSKQVQLTEFTLELRKIRFGEESIGYAAGLNKLAVAVENTGAYTKAEALYKRAKHLLEKITADNHSEHLVSLHGLAFNYYNTARYREGISLLVQARETIKRIYTSAQPTVAHSKVASHDPDFSRLPDMWPAGYNLTLQALMYSRLGEYPKAAGLYEKALDIATNTTGAESENAAWVLTNYAFLYAQMGMYKEAILSFQKASYIGKKIYGKKFDEQYAGLLFDMAHAYCQLGEFNEALPLFQRALPAIKKSYGDKHQYYAMIIDGMAFIYQQIGEYNKAIALYSEALAIYQHAFNSEHPYYATALHNLASVLTSNGEHKKALSSYHRALAIRKKIIKEDHPEYAQGLAELASLYERLGNYDSARYLYKQALTLIKKSVGEDHYYFANCLAKLASLFFRVEKFDTAIHLYKQVLTIRGKVFGGEHPDDVSVLNGLGWLYKMSNDSLHGNHALLAGSKLQLNHLKRGYSTLSEQEKMVFQRKVAYEFSYIPSLLYFHPAQPSLVNQAYQNELGLKGMILEDQKQILNNFRRSKDSTVLALYQRWRFNKTFVGAQLLLPAKQRVPYLDSLQHATNQLEQQLSRHNAAEGVEANQDISTKNIAAKLSRDEAAIEFLRFELYNGKWTDSIMYAAILLLPGDSCGQFIFLFEEKQLLAMLGSSYNSKSSDLIIERLYGNEKGKGSLSDSLYSLIWKPLEKYLTGIHTVYYAPAGLLHRIAFNALQNNRTDFLIDQYELRRLVSTRSIMPGVQVRPGLLSASIWGNINYDLFSKGKNGVSTGKQMTRGSSNIPLPDSSFLFYNSDTRGKRNQEWPQLKAAIAEFDTLNQLLGSAGIKISSFSDSMASEDAFKMLHGNSPQILHLATHGFFLPVTNEKLTVSYGPDAGNAFRVQRNPLFRSGLVLAGGNHTWSGRIRSTQHEDGILTAYEIAQMDLTNTQLLVLSACETALGDLQGNEGVIGLQRAFKLAGVHQMILTLWSVYDDPTREIITMFYRNLLKGQSTASALRNAQLKMKESYPEPYYWAGFILIE